MNTWEELLIDSSSTLREAMEVIDRTGLQTVLVISSDSLFVGTLSDGDIRRAFLIGANFSDGIEAFVNRNPVVISDMQEATKAIKIMERLGLRCIPVIKDRQVINVIRFDWALPQRVLQNSVLIMAGGRGERLRPFTDSTPKPLMKVGGKTLLEILLNRLETSGLTDVWISVHYLSNKIEEICGSGDRFDLNISYIRERHPLGTAGAYLELPRDVRSRPVVIINADLLTNVNFHDLVSAHESSSAEITIGVIQHTLEIPFGVVKLKNGRVNSISEKPRITHQVYAGIGVYNETAFDGYKQGAAINATDVYLKLLSEDRHIGAFEISDYWRDIGTVESLKSANKDLGMVDK